MTVLSDIIWIYGREVNLLPVKRVRVCFCLVFVRHIVKVGYETMLNRRVTSQLANYVASVIEGKGENLVFYGGFI